MSGIEVRAPRNEVFNIGLRATGFAIAVALAVALPGLVSEYWVNAIIVPTLILALAGLGLNLLTGYAGQLSLGAGGFMMVGAYTTYAFQLRLPELPLPIALVASGLIVAVLGAAFGFPSTRIKGFYLIVSTLAAQFFFEWLFQKFPWFYNGNSSATISLPKGLTILGLSLEHPAGRFYLTAAVTASITALVYNLVRSQTGRNWMAVRDMDTAAGVIGIPVTKAKLQAFAASSFILGIAGALWAFAYLGTASVQSFDLDRSYQILFIIIVGGMGTIRGAFIGAVFIGLSPLGIDWLAQKLFSGHIDAGLLQNIEKAIFGFLIIWFLIKEPEGLAKLLSRQFSKFASLFKSL